MTETVSKGFYYIGGRPVAAESAVNMPPRDEARERTMTYSILRRHSSRAQPGQLHITFDALISHDITYVGIIQSARASGLREFPLPYALTNCHNSLCAVGGTINEDDHVFGLSAAKKYGGIYVPPNLAVIHQYAREELACCGGMILGSDSHTRCGAYGAMGIGEGGGELVKQLLGGSYDLQAPEVVLVWLEGSPRRGVGPHDVALALVAAAFPNGRVKNKVLEFAGPGVSSLSCDFRMGIDVMTTETSCLSSIWETDEATEKYYESVGRPQDYRRISPQEGAYYDDMIKINLSEVECMIALPFHPSKAYTIHELQEHAESIFQKTEEECQQQLGVSVEMNLRCCVKNGKAVCEQGIIVGCAGGMYENIAEAAAVLKGKSIGNGYFDLSVYPSSAPISLAITKDGIAAQLMEAGAVIKQAFCGPCFGAGDTPAHNTLSVRHATRNFASREGSKPGQGQIAAVALMDARSIAATAVNGGVITAATDIEYEPPAFDYKFDDSIYKKRVYNGFGRAMPDARLRLGPNIKDWPHIYRLEENLLLKLCAVICDEVTTTDELIPSGETSSYRSNPVRLAEFALSRRVPEYVGRSKIVRAMEEQRRTGGVPAEAAAALELAGGSLKDTMIGSCIYAHKPGDGSAREQAASCQKVLGGLANICREYATKRYRSNCINWGIVPFTIAGDAGFACKAGDFIYVPRFIEAMEEGREEVAAKIIAAGAVSDITLLLRGLTADEKLILREGCLMNYYAAGYGHKGG